MKTSGKARFLLMLLLGVVTAGLAPAAETPVPAIHQPRIVGSTPGRPFLFLIPATGEGPLFFAAKNLPAGSPG